MTGKRRTKYLTNFEYRTLARFDSALAHAGFEIPTVDILSGIRLEVEPVTDALQALILIKPAHRRFIHQYRHRLLQQLHSLGGIETCLLRLKRLVHRRIGKFQPLGDSCAEILVQVLAGVDNGAASENIHTDFAVLDRGK